MKVPTHIIGHYHRSVRRYRKIIARIKKNHDSSSYQCRVLIQALRKLRKKIAELHFQLKIACASGFLALSLSVTPALAQTNNGPFNLQPRHLNPLAAPFLFRGSTFPAPVDLDKDGDYDLVVGYDEEWNYYTKYYNDPLRYFVNIGSKTKPVYEEKTGDGNPFNSLQITGRERGPVFADIDKDNDDDLFVGLNNGSILYFNNDDGVFTEQTGTWDPVTKQGNPLGEINFGRTTKLSFADMDSDSDLDVIMGAYSYTTLPDPPYTREQKSIHYYKNDGNGTFTEASTEFTISPMPSEYSISPTLADLDADGDLDMVFGGYYFGLSFYRQISPGNFVEETGTWDPISKTGNPFEDIYYPNTQPVFLDLDDDNDLDLLVGDGDGDSSYPYPAHIIHYFENTGNNVFVERKELENPVGGIDVGANASPVLVDIDGDNDLDALIGNKYGPYDYGYYNFNSPVYYDNDQGIFKKVEEIEETVEIENPFQDMESQGIFYHDMADLDGDGDLDVIAGAYNGSLSFYRNDGGGSYTKEIEFNPFAGINIGNQSSPKLADIDNDQDLDLIINNEYNLYYFENTGTIETPSFVEKVGSENPFLVIDINGHVPFIQMVDIDHDGDLDVLVSSYLYDSSEDYSNQLIYYENIGAPSIPQFELAPQQPFIEVDIPNDLWYRAGLQPFLTDFDQDGDLDMFVGDGYGTTSFVLNDNPAAIPGITTASLSYKVGSDGPLIIQPLLTLSDADSDLIVQATVSIVNFQSGDELIFAPHPGISGSYNSSNGLLTFKGKATLSEYESLLRTVAYQYYLNTGNRTRAPKKLTLEKSIEFRIYDTDFTNPKVGMQSLSVNFNEVPTFSNHAISIHAGGTITFDLKTLIADGNGSADIDLTSIKIVQALASGAPTAIDVNGNLSVQYSTSKFTGSETLIVEACDLAGECAQSSITFNVSNAPPVFNNKTLNVSAGGIITFDLKTLISDSDGSADLDLSTLKIIQPPGSGAIATIAANGNLTIQYTGLGFTGSEMLTLEVCDLIGSCVQNTITVNVSNAPPVIENKSETTQIGNQLSISLDQLISDPDNNLDLSSLRIVRQPSSGAFAEIDGNRNLIIDYHGINFIGADNLIIEVCDDFEACSQNLITINVENVSSEIEIYNAIAPNSSGDNRFMRILNLPQGNRVTIYNRWGDKVFEVEDYNNALNNKRFEGNTNNGNALPSGTYFYRIEIPENSNLSGGELLTGYLSVKQ